MNEEDTNEQSVVIFTDGSIMADQMEGENQQHLSIGDDGITIVVTPENEQQVSELLRALQAQHGGGDTEVQYLAETGAEANESLDQDDVQTKVKEEYTLEDVEKAVRESEPAPKRKRGRPPKNPEPDTGKKAKLIELALLEADASVAEGVSNLKSSRLREKAAKQGGLKKLWMDKDDSEDELVNVELDRSELRSDGEDILRCEISAQVSSTIF